VRGLGSRIAAERVRIDKDKQRLAFAASAWNSDKTIQDKSFNEDKVLRYFL